MKRRLTLNGLLHFKRYDEDSWSVILEISYEELTLFFMEFQMLEYRHSEKLTISSHKSLDSIEFSVSSNNESDIIQENPSKYQINISQRAIGVVSSFIIQYYRDYLAPVEHVDIELAHKGSLGSDSTLVLKANESAEPMSEIEARKRLGME